MQSKINRHRSKPGFETGKKGLQKGRAVMVENGYIRAFLDSQMTESPGQPIDSLIRLVVGQLIIPVGDGQPIRESSRGFSEKSPYIHKSPPFERFLMRRCFGAPRLQFEQKKKA
jgi:hypothetical protein